MGSDLHIVGFRVGAETFGIPINKVHEIVRVPEITSVPDSPEFVEGVINLRGRIVSVVDLRKRFGQLPSVPDKKNRIIVVESEGKLAGLMVDAAFAVMKVPEADVEPAPNLAGSQNAGYVTGMGKLNGRLIILLDLGKVLQRAELRTASELAEAVTA